MSEAFHTEEMTLNMGPQHPSTHGVLRFVIKADGEVMRWLTLKQIPELERQAVVSGGMLPKLNACKEALTHGVKRVRILPAEAAHLLPDLISTKVHDGTEVMVA